MHELWLNSEERNEVALAVACCIDALHDEIRHTHDRDVRAMLKRRREVLQAVRARIEAERAYTLAEVR